MKECTRVRKALFRRPFAGWDNPVHQLDDDEIEKRNKWVQAAFDNWVNGSPVTIISESEDFTNVLGNKVITLKVSLPQLDKGNLLNYY